MSQISNCNVAITNVSLNGCSTCKNKPICKYSSVADIPTNVGIFKCNYYVNGNSLTTNQTQPFTFNINDGMPINQSSPCDLVK